MLICPFFLCVNSSRSTLATGLKESLCQEELDAELSQRENEEVLPPLVQPTFASLPSREGSATSSSVSILL